MTSRTYKDLCQAVYNSILQHITFSVFQVSSMEQRILNLQKYCAKTSSAEVLEIIDSQNLSGNIKENVLMCIRSAQARHPNGMRYSQKWLYECILLKIKDRRSYLHLQRHNLLPLPSISSIERYLRRLRPAYGFQSATFDLLRKKADEMSAMEKEGMSMKL